MFSASARRALEKLNTKHLYTGFRKVNVTMRQQFEPNLFCRLLQAIIVSDLSLLTKQCRVYVRVVEIYYPCQVCPVKGTTVKCKIYSTIRRLRRVKNHSMPVLNSVREMVKQ